MDLVNEVVNLSGIRLQPVVNQPHMNSDMTRKYKANLSMQKCVFVAAQFNIY